MALFFAESSTTSSKMWANHPFGRRESSRNLKLVFKYPWDDLVWVTSLFRFLWFLLQDLSNFKSSLKETVSF